MADGLDYATATVVVNDTTGAPIDAFAVSLGSSVGSDVITPSSGATNASGTFTARIRATTSGLRTITVTIGTFTLTATPTFNATRALPAFISAASLPTPRAGLAAAVGNDGMIYALGGEVSGTPGTANDVFDPVALTWTAASAALPTARSLLAAVAGPDGMVYALGGCGTRTPCDLDTAEAYNADAGTWNSAVPMMPTARAGLGASLATGVIFAIGGGSTPLSVNESYNTSTAAWLSGGATGPAPLPTPVANLAVALGSDGHLYALGGVSAAGFANGTALAQDYNPGANNWTAATAMPAPASSLAASGAPDGRIYALGGSDTSGNDLATVNAFNPATGAWFPIGPLNVARQQLAVALSPSGNLIVIGGEHGGSPTAAAATEIYGPMLTLAKGTGNAVTVSGTNFAAQANVAITLDSPTGTSLGSGTTDASGNMTGSSGAVGVTVPTGTHRVFATDDRSQYPVSAPISE